MPATRSKRKRLLITISLTAGLTLCVVGAVAWRWLTGPLYAPGDLAGTVIEPFLPPTDAAGPARWETPDGIRIHHFAVGQGTPVVVVHGGPGHPFAEPIAALAPLTGDYRFTYYDQRGCGRSTRPVDRPPGDNAWAQMQALEKRLGIAAQLADLDRVRRAVVAAPDDPVILLGHSFGGFLATLYAAEFPERVRGLVLVAPADLLVMPGEGPDLFATVQARLPAAQQEAFAGFLAEYLDFPGLLGRGEAELQALNNRFADYYTSAEGRTVAGPAFDPGLTGGWMTHAQYLSLGRRHDYRPALSGLAVPTLVLHGDQDLVPAEGSAAYARILGQARCQVVEGAGHQVFADRPVRFRELVATFLAGL